MDNKKKTSLLLLAVGVALIIFGFFKMYAVADELSNFFAKEDSVGMYILSVGAVLTIFGTGSMVGKNS